MRIIDGAGAWGARINFVDENNVVVGFDNIRDCCEDFGYYLTKEKPAGVRPADELEGLDFPGFNFDTSFTPAVDLLPSSDCVGGSLTFRLVNAEGEELFLTLYNYHNGYYCHGWELKNGDATVAEGEM